MKILKIDFCTQCPHHEVGNILSSDDSYMIICNHPGIIGQRERETKIKNIPSIFLGCPLPDAD
jgi:hypothetical protein